MTPPRWATVLVLVMLGVGILWLRFNAAPGELSGEAWKMAAQGDLVAYYLPMTELVAGRLARLELPLWNPHVCSGIPLLATLQVGAIARGWRRLRPTAASGSRAPSPWFPAPGRPSSGCSRIDREWARPSST